MLLVFDTDIDAGKVITCCERIIVYLLLYYVNIKIAIKNKIYIHYIRSINDIIETGK